MMSFGRRIGAARLVAAFHILLLVFGSVPASATSLVPCLELDAQHLSEISAKYDFIAYVKIKRRISPVAKLFWSKPGETFRSELVTFGDSTIASYEMDVIRTYQDKSANISPNQRNIALINTNWRPFHGGDAFIVFARSVSRPKSALGHLSAPAKKVVTRSGLVVDMCGTVEYTLLNTSILETLEKN